MLVEPEALQSGADVGAALGRADLANALVGGWVFLVLGCCCDGGDSQGGVLQANQSAIEREAGREQAS